MTARRLTLGEFYDLALEVQALFLQGNQHSPGKR